MKRFDGRAVFITGAAHGIGRATGERLAREGAKVTLADVDLDPARAAAGEIERAGGRAWAVHCDVRHASSVDAAIAAGVERFGRLDALVTTAGGDTPEPPFGETEDDLWQRLIDFNLTSVMRSIRAALPHLLDAGSGANVVTIGSVNGLAAFGSYPYSAAKAGLQNLMKNLAAEYGHRGLRFNLVAPATIRTRVWDNQPGALDRLASLYPLGRVGEPEDIAAAVSFLASDDAAWITGTTLPVDGGVLTGPRGILFSRQEREPT